MKSETRFAIGPDFKLPIVLALALYLAPTTVMLLFGLLSIYAGYVLWAASSDMGILGIGAVYLAIGSIVSGITLLAFGGSLAAILRALKRLHGPSAL